MMQNKTAGKSIYNIAFIVIVAVALSYIFLGTDLIPDSIGLLLPGKILGFVDDAVVVLGLVFFLAKIKQKTVGGKGLGKGLGIWGWLITIAVVSAVLFYIFMPVDLIPDAIPWAGFMDDAASAIVGLAVVQRIRRQLKQ
jgi:uncharacterized membrane protein YkvA (DUF1232 family)